MRHARRRARGVGDRVHRAAVVGDHDDVRARKREQVAHDVFGQVELNLYIKNLHYTRHVVSYRFQSYRFNHVVAWRGRTHRMRTTVERRRGARRACRRAAGGVVSTRDWGSSRQAPRHACHVVRTTGVVKTRGSDPIWAHAHTWPHPPASPVRARRASCPAEAPVSRKTDDRW